MLGKFGPADQPEVVSKPPTTNFARISSGLIWKAKEKVMPPPTCPLLSIRLKNTGRIKIAAVAIPIMV